MKYNKDNIDGVRFRAGGSTYLIDLSKDKNVRNSDGDSVASYTVSEIVEKFNDDKWSPISAVTNTYPIY